MAGKVLKLAAKWGWEIGALIVGQIITNHIIKREVKDYVDKNVLNKKEVTIEIDENGNVVEIKED